MAHRTQNTHPDFHHLCANSSKWSGRLQGQVSVKRTAALFTSVHAICAPLANQCTCGQEDSFITCTRLQTSTRLGGHYYTDSPKGAYGLRTHVLLVDQVSVSRVRREPGSVRNCSLNQLNMLYLLLRVITLHRQWRLWHELAMSATTWALQREAARLARWRLMILLLLWQRSVRFA